MILITAASLALRAYIPALVNWNAPHDDELFARMAASLLRGDWLGGWDVNPEVAHATLAKGPGYAIYLAAIKWTGLPPHIASFGVYLLGALLLFVALRPILGRAWSVALYATLALNPVIFSHYFSRVYRDQLVAALALLALGVSVLIASRATGSTVRRGRALAWSLVGGAALGSIIGFLRITRGDVLWIMLVSFAVLLLFIVSAWPRRSASMWLRIGSAVTIVGALSVAIPQAIASTNDRWYDVRLLDDFSSGTFAEAMELWAAVQVADSDPFMRISRAQREAVYEVSPTARRLQPELEGVDSFWIDHACGFQADTLVPCDDYGSYITWAIRDATVRAGVDSPADFQSFFAAMASEISSACESGSLNCGASNVSPVIPPMERISERVVVANFATYVGGAIEYRMGRATQRLPEAGDEGVEMWEQAANGVHEASDLLLAGHHPTVVSQDRVVGLLATIYRFGTLLSALVVAVALFARQLWTSPAGRLGVAVLLGWAANLGIVAVFYAGANRVHGGMVLYTMPGQSYLIAGLMLALAATWQGVRSRQFDARRPEGLSVEEEHARREGPSRPGTLQTQ